MQRKIAEGFLKTINIALRCSTKVHVIKSVQI